MKSWPKLSETLTHRRERHRCQACDFCDDDDGTLVRPWLEHDERDKPTAVVVMLCKTCSDKIIEPHPRLYREVEPMEPFPGQLRLCQGCKHQAALVCTRSLLSGGPGVHLVFLKPLDVHLCRSPRSKSGWIKVWQGPVISCDSKEPS